MTDQRWDRLPCGREKEYLLAVVADGDQIAAGSHEGSRPDCQAALSELTALWPAVHQWRGRAVHVPADLLQTVIARVRRMAQSPRHVVARASTGLTTVTSWVVGLLGSEAAQRVPGWLGSVRVRQLFRIRGFGMRPSAAAPMPSTLPRSAALRSRSSSPSPSALWVT